MSPVTTAMLVVAIILVMDSIIVLAVMRMMASAWNVMADAHPATPPLEGAVRREFQSFKMGLFNMGWCVHVAVDEQRLHLFPVKLMRLGGAKAASVPWEQVRLADKQPWSKSWVDVTIGHTDLRGPAWALSLAQRPEEA